MTKKRKKGYKGTTKGSSDPCPPHGGPGQTFVDRDLMNTNPLTEQFSPTEEAMISNTKRMGGVA